MDAPRPGPAADEADEVYEVGGSWAPEGRRARRWVVPVVAVALAGAVGAAVLVARVDPGAEASAPSPSTSSAPPATDDDEVMDLTGVGEVRLGMTFRQYRQTDHGRGSLRQVTADDADGCFQYEDLATDGGVTTWAWVRDQVVVAVGMSRAFFDTGEPARQGTAFGIDLGDGFDAGVAAGLGLEWDPAAPVPTARNPGGEAVLADVDSDGTLDYLAVADPAARDCDADPADVERLWGWNGATGVIEDGGGAGIAVGTPANEVRLVPGWVEQVGSDRCRIWTSESGYVAFASRSDRVTGFSGRDLAGTPVAGLPREAAAATLAPVSQEWEEYPTGANGRLVLGDGTRVELSTAAEVVLVPHLDRWYDIGEEVVAWVGVGEFCD